MATLAEQIEQARQEALGTLSTAHDSAGLEEWNREYLGKKGRLTALFRGVGALVAEERARLARVARAERASAALVQCPGFRRSIAGASRGRQA